MPCDKLKQLRAEATTLRLQLEEQHAKTRASRKDDRRIAVRSTSDLALFLQRKLLRTSQKIEQHIAEHDCQK
jgi:hypothetical protein